MISLYYACVVKRGVWLSITPEPERELPEAVATLVAGGRPGEAAVAAERARVERLVTRGSQRRWLEYLHEAVALSEDVRGGPEVAAARARVRAVIANHHNLLLGLPGAGARRTAGDRARLTREER